MPEETLVVFSTFPDLESARTALRIVVEERLAACGNILPQVESIYRWKEKIETAAEVLVIFKTTIGNYQLLEQRLRGLHSYEVPEIIAFRAHTGLPSYLQWVNDSCVHS